MAMMALKVVTVEAERTHAAPPHALHARAANGRWLRARLHLWYIARHV